MLNHKKLFVAVISGLLVLAIGAVALVSYTSASAASQTARTAAAANSMMAGRGGHDDMPGKGGASDAYLAQALGISEEELQTAQAAAWQKAVDLALEKGLITQAQADQLKAGDQLKLGRRGLGMFLVGDDAIDMDALLAEELGISVEELQTAREEASELALQARIDSGEITADQAELMNIHQALKDYIDRQALSAAALGMTVEELQAAHQEGKDMSALLEEKGLTQEEFQSAYQAALEAALQQAVKDGVITQAQADLVLANLDSFGRGGMPGPGGDRPHSGRGPAPADNCNCDCPAPEDSQDNG